MAIPDFQTLMRPVLVAHEGHEEIDRASLRQAVADHFGLTDEERAELLESGRQRRFANRVEWTLTHLVHAGLLTRPRRGMTKITPAGTEAVERHPERIDTGVLFGYPEYERWRRGTRGQTHCTSSEDPGQSATPEEALQAAHEELNAAVAEELRQRIQEVSPEMFEQLVVDLLLAMGYGGSRTQAGERLGRSGDGGIDGVIREDRLGLDAIYIQAKRWAPERSVNRPEVQGFVGALQGHHAAKGVFLTTASFSSGARDYADGIGANVVLIDGQELAELMIEHGVGVTTRQRYEVKRIDEDDFPDLT